MALCYVCEPGLDWCIRMNLCFYFFLNYLLKKIIKVYYIWKKLIYITLLSVIITF